MKNTQRISRIVSNTKRYNHDRNFELVIHNGIETEPTLNIQLSLNLYSYTGLSNGYLLLKNNMYHLDT